MYVKCKKPRNLLERLPIWYREDLLAGVINDETEQIKLETYYQMLCSYPIQPIQVWSEVNTESETWEYTLTASNSISFGTGQTKFSPKITIEFNLTSEEPTPEVAPISDIFIYANGFGYKIVKDFYPGDVLVFYPKRGILHNDVAVPETNFEEVSGTIKGHPQCNTNLGIDFTPNDYTNSITVTVEEEFYPASNNLFGRFYTKKEFPLKQVTLYNEDGEILQQYKYKEHQNPPLALLIEEEETQVQKFYFGVQYYGLQGEILKGFPQQIQPRSWNNILTESETVLLDDDADGTTLEYLIRFGYGNEEDIDNLGDLEPINGLIINSGDTTLDVIASLYPGDILEINKDGKVLLNRVHITSHTLEGSNAVEFLFTPTYYVPSMDVTITQDDYFSDEKYAINSILDDVVEGYGLKRRRYKQNLVPADGPKTYPKFYLYDVEQDFYLETRLLADYFYQKDYSEKVEIKDENENTLIELTQKEIGSRFIDITWYTGINPVLYNVEVTSYEPNRADITEIFSSETIVDLIEEINTNSSLIEAMSINDGVPINGNGFISLKGVFQTYGGISSEIYHSLGCLPIMSDITDHLLIWDKDKWNSGKMWGGDIYLPGLYYLWIPLNKIPANIILLNQNEIEAIIDKYKILGTMIIAHYSYKESVNHNVLIQNGAPLRTRDIIVNIPPFAAFKTDRLNKVCMKPSILMSVRIREAKKTITSGGAHVSPDIFPGNHFIAITEDGELLFNGPLVCDTWDEGDFDLEDFGDEF